MTSPQKNILIVTFIIVFFLLHNSVSAVSIPEKKVLQNTLHVPFIQNQGQIGDSSVLYRADTFACGVSITKEGHLVYGLRVNKKGRSAQNQTVRERLIDSGSIKVTGKVQAATTANYYIGNNPEKWRKAIPCFDRLSMGQIYKGIRLELQAHDNNVEKLFYVTAGADPDKIRIGVEGIRSLQVNTKGELELITHSGVMRFSKPVAYQHINGKKITVGVNYQVQGLTYGFRIGNYDNSEELIIDPLIASFPVSDTECKGDIRALAKDSSGNVYAAGFLGDDCVIYKLDSRLEKVLAVVAFGSGTGGIYQERDMIQGMVLDSNNNIYVAGRTDEKEFPVTEGCFDDRPLAPHNSMGEEGFITKFSPEDLSLLASTFIGGDRWDEIEDIAIDKEDNIYVTGYTWADSDTDKQSFPSMENGYDQEEGENGKWKAFVLKLKNDLGSKSLLAATFLGGATPLIRDHAYCIAIGSDGSVYVAGQNYYDLGHTAPPDFPVTKGCMDDTFTGRSEVFVAKLDSNLEKLLAATYLGGLNDEKPSAMVLDSDDNVYVGGWTRSKDFPTVQGGFKTQYLQEQDGFVVKMNRDLNELLSATLLNGELTAGTDSDGDDEVYCLALTNDSTSILVAGRTESKNFPVTPGAFDGTFDMCEGPTLFGRNPKGVDYGEAFLTYLDTNLTQCLSSTFFGGEELDYIDAILFNGEDTLVAGETNSDDFPLMQGDWDKERYHSRGFISRFNPNESSPDPGPNPNPDDGKKYKGHWQSNMQIQAVAIGEWVYFDIDVCENGSFSGEIGAYIYCDQITGLYTCYRAENSPTETISGKIDFKSKKGTMKIGDCTQEVSLEVTEKSSKVLSIRSNLDGLCGWESNAVARMSYKGEPGDYCTNEEPNNQEEPSNQEESGNGGGGGGGGCFITIIGE